MVIFDGSNLPLAESGLCSIQGNARETLSNLAKFRRYRTEEVLFRQGEEGVGIYVVCSGAVKMTRKGEAQEQFSLACSSSVIGLPGVMGGTYHATATVLADSTLAFVPRTLFLEFLQTFPLAKAIAAVLREQQYADKPAQTVVGRWVM